MNIWKLAPLMLVAGCAVGPNYQRPAVSLTTSFVGGEGSAAAKLAESAWWSQYNDAMLNSLIQRGLTQNYDIANAQEAIRQADAQLRETGVNSALSGSAAGSWTKAGGDHGTATTTTKAGSLSADIVLDLFGGIRREREAAKANLDASFANLEVTRLSWLAEVIAAYSNARYYQQALELERQTIDTRQKTLDITQRQLDAGDSTTYEVAEAQATLDAAKANLPGYLAQFNANVFALATLVNEPAGPLLQQMQKGSAALRIPGSPGTGVPADLLRNRPDLRYYEALLHQQVAEIGVDEAAFLPSVSLGGTIGATAGVSSWSYGPSISLPIFNQGALHAARDAQVSAAKQAEITYRSEVASAVEDVQKAASNLKQYRLQTSALQRAASSYTKALDLAQTNYQNGAITLLDLLDTVESEASARMNALSAQNTAAQEWATLQIATGAGASVAGIAASPAQQTVAR